MTKYPMNQWSMGYRTINGKKELVWIYPFLGPDRTIQYKIKSGDKSLSGLFKNEHYKKYSDIVNFKTPEDATKSTIKLEAEFNKPTTTLEKRLRIARVTQYSANRAYASAKKEDLSPEIQENLRNVGATYNASAKKLWSLYNVSKKALTGDINVISGKEFMKQQE